MTTFVEARYGFTWNWATGDAGWGTSYNFMVRGVAALMNARILDATLTLPPGSPVDGDSYFLPVGSSGAWAGQDGKIASWQGGVWEFYHIPKGLRAYNEATARFEWFNGSAMVAESATGGTGGLTTTSLAALDLSTLPTFNPGGGKLWLNGGVLQVGA